MKEKILKQAVAVVLSAAITIFPFSPHILALDGDNSGTGEWSGIEGGSSTWDIDHQGYRICIVNESGSPVSNAVDIHISNTPCHAAATQQAVLFLLAVKLS